jgi:hypothetical protein
MIIIVVSSSATRLELPNTGHYKSPLHRITTPEAVLLNHNRDLKHRIHVTPLHFVVSNTTISSLYSQCTFTIFNLFTSCSNSAFSIAQLTKHGQQCDPLCTKGKLDSANY